MTSKNHNLYALLIGVNYYFPNRLDGGTSYGHLHGCVRDVEAMESFLKTRLGVADSQIIKLTASHNEADKSKPTEDKSVWPTYDNIIAGFQQLHDVAQAGDQVVIHYSGHGGRAKSIYSAAIKPAGFDEAFAPTDIGTDEGRYLRDLQLVYWLQKFSDKGVTTTVVLDCCHSGGMTRGDAVTRGSADIDNAVRPAETSDADAVATWQSLTDSVARSGSLNSGGLPASDNWVVIAACRPQESAFEYTVDGERRGALTYWLMDTLNGSLSLSYKQVHQRLVGRIQSKFSYQRPQLYGDGKRAVFGQARIDAQFAVPVLKYSERRSEVTLNAGIAQGIRRGAQFAIFPLNATELNDFSQAVARVTVFRDGATESKATIDEQSAPIELGAQAVLINPASVKLRGFAQLQTEGQWALPTQAQAALKSAHAAAQFGGFIEWVEEGEVDFIVAANKGHYEIWDATGEAIPFVNPPLALTDETAPAKVIDRLIHLTRYRNVQRLANNDSRTRGAPSVTFEWVGVHPDHVFTEGDVAHLLVRNDSAHDVEIAMLELDESWQIKQIYPEQGVDTYTFAPGEAETLEIDVFLSGDAAAESTIYKLFATIKGTNFHMLELPSLDEPLMKSEMRSPSRDSELEQLLAQLIDIAPSMRAGRLRSTAGRQWTTAQVTLQVQK